MNKIERDYINKELTTLEVLASDLETSYIACMEWFNGDTINDAKEKDLIDGLEAITKDINRVIYKTLDLIEVVKEIEED